MGKNGPVRANVGQIHHKDEGMCKLLSKDIIMPYSKLRLIK